jgi:hypothetical protein
LSQQYSNLLLLLLLLLLLRQLQLLHMLLRQHRASRVLVQHQGLNWALGPPWEQLHLQAAVLPLLLSLLASRRCLLRQLYQRVGRVHLLPAAQVGLLQQQ